jgi:hypothetical protein
LEAGVAFGSKAVACFLIASSSTLLRRGPRDFGAGGGRFAGLAKGAKVFCFFPLTVERVPLLCAPRLLREERSGRRECGGFFRFGKVWLGSVELLGWRFLEQPKERENGEKENFLQNLV